MDDAPRVAKCQEVPVQFNFQKKEDALQSAMIAHANSRSLRCSS